MAGARSLLFFWKISLARICRLLMCIGTDLPISKFFQKMRFYHCTLCADIFRVSGYFIIHCTAVKHPH